MANPTPAEEPRDHAHHLHRQRHDDPPHRRAGIRVHAAVRVPADPDARNSSRRTAPGWSRAPTTRRPATVVLCFQSYVVKTPHHNILVDACIGNDKTFPLRPTWNAKKDGNWMAALKAAGLGPRRHRLRHVHASARRPCRLEHQARKRPLGPDLPQGALPVLEKGIRLLDRGAPEDPARQHHRKRAAGHRGQQGRAGHQRPRAQRPHPADPDPRPHARPFRGLRRAGRRPGGVHRRPDPFADPGPLSGTGHAGRYRPRPGRRHPAALSSSATATPTRCAARCTSPRPRSATSSAGATASAWNTSRTDRTRHRTAGVSPACASEIRRTEHVITRSAATKQSRSKVRYADRDWFASLAMALERTPE